MENPVLRRANEFLRDDEAFLAIISPEPVSFYLERPGRNRAPMTAWSNSAAHPAAGRRRSQGCSNTLRCELCSETRASQATKTFSPRSTACGAIRDEQPYVLGCRLPMESDYRDFWEFPYANEVKTSLMASLLQARTVLGWFRHLRGAGIAPEQVHLVTRPESQAVLDTIGGVEAASVLRRAAEVENRVYKVMTALVAPPESSLVEEVGEAYKPFDHIDRIRVSVVQGTETSLRDLVPLAIFDDAHVLHPDQFRAFEHFLVRRELRIARWIIARFDVLLPDEALAAAIEDRSDPTEYPGVTSGRDTEPILLQSSGSAGSNGNALEPSRRIWQPVTYAACPC